MHDFDDVCLDLFSPAQQPAGCVHKFSAIMPEDNWENLIIIFGRNDPHDKIFLYRERKRE